MSSFHEPSCSDDPFAGSEHHLSLLTRESLRQIINGAELASSMAQVETKTRFSSLSRVDQVHRSCNGVRCHSKHR